MNDTDKLSASTPILQSEPLSTESQVPKENQPAVESTEMALVENYYERRMELDISASESTDFLYQVLPSEPVLEASDASLEPMSSRCDISAVGDENREKDIFSRQKNLSPYTPTIDIDSYVKTV